MVVDRLQDYAMRIAFKEWAAICRALGEGRQIVILRKGGIVEPGGAFRFEHGEFLLFPTYLHQSADSLVPAARNFLEEVQAEVPKSAELVFRHCATVTDSFRVQSQEALTRLRGYHVWSDAVVEERFHRWQKSLHVLVVRVYTLPQPAAIPMNDQYTGCKSWVGLREDISVEGSRPVISEDEYQRRAEEIGSMLG
jgi:hypothetical protein